LNIPVSIPKKKNSYRPWLSAKYAIEGIYIAFSREKNLWLQLSLGLTFAGLAVAKEHWVIAMGNLILMVLVMSLEMLNSAFETLCDLVEPGHSQQVKIIKDMSAGSVLLVASLWGILIVYEIFIVIFLGGGFVNLKI
jgi:diacylglycerol kinase